MQIEVFYDRSDLVGLTLNTVHENLLSGFVLVVAVVWLFLRSIAGLAHRRGGDPARRCSSPFSGCTCSGCRPT